jgi:hypothetical protein
MSASVVPNLGSCQYALRLLVGTTVSASTGSARRAARIDPVVTLHYE